MAECLEEFDEATPLKRTYCSRLTAEEFEEQSGSCTEKALLELMSHLDDNPEALKSSLSKRKKQEAEESSLLSFVKVKLWSFVSGDENGGCSVSDSECREHVSKLKDDMMKAFDYSQEAKGHRFSKRLAEKRNRSKMEAPKTPPRPPPIPPAFHLCTPVVHATLTRRPLTQRKAQAPVKAVVQESSTKGGGLIEELKGSQARRKLRRRVERSPGGTPYGGWPKKRGRSEMLPFFNDKLVQKFQSTKSPTSATPLHTMASPGTFESPL